MANERCGPRFVLRGTDFTKVAVSEVSPTVSSGRPSQRGHHRVMGFSPDWCEAVTVSRHVRLDDFHPSEEALTSRSRYSSTVSQSRALRCSEAKWKLNDTVHCFHLNVPFQVFGFIAFMMAVNQTPGLNLNMECYLLWEQLHWWTGRCVCRATSSVKPLSFLSQRFAYFCHFSKQTKWKGPDLKNKNMTELFHLY